MRLPKDPVELQKLAEQAAARAGEITHAQDKLRELDIGLASARKAHDKAAATIRGLLIERAVVQAVISPRRRRGANRESPSD